MFAVALLFAPVVLADECHVSNNDPDTGLNYFDCNNSGRCVQQPSGQRCECCDATDSSNWCSGMDGVLALKFSGEACTTVEYTHGVGFGWRFETPDDGTPALTCSDMDSDPPAEGGLYFSTTPNIQGLVQGALAMGGYNAITLHVACHTCRPGNECDYSNTAPVSKGLTAGFWTDLNTYYHRPCFGGSISQPKDCPQNFDLGISAYNKLWESFGPGAQDVTARLNTLIDGSSPQCDDPQLNCLNSQDTTATVFQSLDYKATKTHIATTSPPTPAPIAPPTEEMAAPADTGCINGDGSVCGGLSFIWKSGESCCPEGLQCYAVVPGIVSQCKDSCPPGWAC